MMLVGPMKKKMVTTSIIIVVVLVAFFGVLGYFVLKGKNSEISDLTAKATVVEKYVLTKDLPSGHILVDEDMRLASVKEESTPKDSFGEYKNQAGEYLRSTKDSLIGRRLIIDVSENTTLTENMLADEDEIITDDLRLEEFSMITIPSNLRENEYVDVRILFPTGEDFSVLLGKKVEKYTENTIFLRLTEDEILTMGSAIVEAYMYEGTKLYATKYVDPMNQLYTHASVDYVAKYSNAVSALVKEKEDKMLEELIAKYTAENPELDATAINEMAQQEVKVTTSDIAKSEIASYANMSEQMVDTIGNAIATNDNDVLNEYRNKIEVSRKVLERTYPVKEEVLLVVKNNPNILDEVKANFDKNALVSAGVQRYDATTLYGSEMNPEQAMIKDAYNRIVERVTAEVESQRNERINYLNSLIAEAE